MANNYTLGRGELHFAKFATGTQNPRGFRYLGNTPEFNLTIESEDLDHYNSDRGIREKDASITLQVDRMGSFTTDNIDPKNLALFFFGTDSVLEVGAPVNVIGEVVEAVEPGLTYALGLSASNPSGVRKISAVVVGDDSSPPVPYTLGTDYTVDAELGTITIVEGGGITAGDNLTVDYTVDASERAHVVSGNTAIEGALRYVAYNPAGEQIDYYMPWVRLVPNGDFALKGDEWQTIPFNVSVLKRSGYEAFYIDGRASATP